MIEKIFPGIPDTLEESDAPWDNLLREDFHVAVYKDKFPVNMGHLLFVPKYNTLPILMCAMEDAMRYGKEMVKGGHWDGFNIGMNYGTTAGQTVKWPHVHLIPRYQGDMEDPTGGVRHVIPEKGNYKKVVK